MEWLLAFSRDISHWKESCFYTTRHLEDKKLIGLIHQGIHKILEVGILNNDDYKCPFSVVEWRSILHFQPEQTSSDELLNFEEPRPKKSHAPLSIPLLNTSRKKAYKYLWKFFSVAQPLMFYCHHYFILGRNAGPIRVFRHQ